MKCLRIVHKTNSIAWIAIPIVLAGVASGCLDSRERSELAASGQALTTPDSEDDTTFVVLETIVETTQGVVEGILTDSGTRIYRGIPYAQPPVGALRFAPPQPASPWPGVRLADTFGPACPQPAGALSAQGPQSEDCLSLNVYAANTSFDAPVLVFIQSPHRGQAHHLRRHRRNRPLQSRLRPPGVDRRRAVARRHRILEGHGVSPASPALTW